MIFDVDAPAVDAIDDLPVELQAFAVAPIVLLIPVLPVIPHGASALPVHAGLDTIVTLEMTLFQIPA